MKRGGGWAEQYPRGRSSQSVGNERFGSIRTLSRYTYVHTAEIFPPVWCLVVKPVRERDREGEAEAGLLDCHLVAHARI